MNIAARRPAAFGIGNGSRLGLAQAGGSCRPMGQIVQ
jgi:hypothetical protein